MSVELFYTEAASGPCGVIVNERGNHTLRCAISFRDPDGGSIESQCCILTAGDVEEWSSFSFVSGGRAVGTFRRTDLPISADETVIPGYGFSPYLAECWKKGARSAAFGWLDEFSGEQLNVRPARFDAVGVENVRVPFQFEPLLGVNRVELSVGGMRTNTYWIQQGRIVISDWNGARSYALGDDVARRLLVTLALP